MTRQTTHTPGPWRIGDAGTAIFGPPNGHPSPITVAPRVLRKGDADRIVTAVNCFDDLVAALQQAVNLIADDLTDCTPENAPEHFAFLDAATDALAKAKGGDHG